MRVLLTILAIIVFTAGCSHKVTVIKTHPVDNAPQEIKKSKVIVSDNHLEQGKHLYFKGKFNQATKHFIRSIANNRENWEAYYYLGLTQQKKERFDRAIGSLNNSLKYAPADRKIRAKINYAIGVSWEQEGYLLKADNIYKQANRLDPEFTQAKVALERIKTKNMQAEKAKKKSKNKKSREAF